MHILHTVLLASSLIAMSSQAADIINDSANYAIVEKTDSIEAIIEKAAHVTPSDRQYDWQKKEFVAFIHFTVNTFTDKEWGDGTESPAIFNPTDLDARQWVKALKTAGMKQVILTCKHHDGFCLWPSAYTEHSVKNSPWKNGNGDVVRELSDACREEGLTFGVYLSPWDRHERSYGDSPRYNEHFCNQLRELLTNYGDIAEVWFDGACGEGPNGKRQVYDWQRYYTLIRELMPKAVIAIMGPDVRWVGTESGYGRTTEWSVLPIEAGDKDAIAADSQKADTGEAFIPKDLMDEDLGSREKIAAASRLIWYPSEVDVSIRPGWFYHASQDSAVKTPEKLVDIYFSSVGRNSLLLLNIPPDTRGLIHENDIASLAGMKKILDVTFASDMAKQSTPSASSYVESHGPSAVSDGNGETYWMAPQGAKTGTIELKLDGAKTFDVIMLQEYIREGQRVESFTIDAMVGGKWLKIVEGTTIGYKRLLRFPEITTDHVRLNILQSRSNPTIATFSLFNSPVETK